MSSKQSFQIYYAGPALASNEMDACDLAPALVAVIDLLEEEAEEKIHFYLAAKKMVRSTNMDINIWQKVVEEA